jgi:hypothetical protein
MKLKLTILAAVFAAGVTASFAFAHDNPGKGKGDAAKAGKCTEVHLRGTIAPQVLNVTIDKASKKLSSAAGTTLQAALGAAGQTIRVDAEACQVVSGTSTVLQIRELHAKVRTPKPATTTAAATTAPATTAASTSP